MSRGFSTRNVRDFVAVTGKEGGAEAAAEFFKKRAGKAKEVRMMKFLRNAPPEAGDEIG